MQWTKEQHDRRAELCRRIAHGDDESADCARHDLADFYDSVGLPTLGRILRQQSLASARNHARINLER
jgi:hypothetical protein